MAALAAILSIGASAQQVTTLYFLENAPMRHTINPAFQPVSAGYVNFSPLGWTSMDLGNNSLTMSDVVYNYTSIDPVTGQPQTSTITALHPNGDKKQLVRQLRSMTYANGGMTFSFLNFGFRYKENGYVHIGINERLETGVTVPKTFLSFFLDGGMQDLSGGVNTLALSGLGLGGSAYTEFSGGYSHKINDQWTVGGKVKFLLGQFYAGLNSHNVNLYASPEAWQLDGALRLDVVGPFDHAYLASFLDGKTGEQVYNAINNGEIDTQRLINTSDWRKMLVPSGYGAAIDLGFTYKPIENLQISAALNDLGFIYWNNGSRYECSLDSSIVKFQGAGQIDYNDPRFKDENGNFSTNILMDTVVNNLKGMLNGVTVASRGRGMARMTSARLNIGVDANFWDNRVGVGLVSATRLYNARLYEEVTIGAAFRPVNWFNIAVSYSLMNNGKYSNIGAGLSFMPYDGVNMTLAMDYIPTTYAGMNINGQTKYVLPYKAKMVNVALGFSIVWGSNRRDKDKDGVWDKIDMCPNTPRGVAVDSVGCPLDEDHDGVPDYLDHCLGTRPEAIAYVDSLGCDKDSDGDGVEDYRDKCPGTPEAAWGKVDSVGCPLDTDGDGVPDYLDECPDTPKEAYGKVDEKGCPKDSDGDGVPDYLDECPDTPEAAHGSVNEKGCPKDSDGDGVPDYKDECPDTPIAAVGFVDEKGCELDSDGDGVPDYKDACPQVAGVKENKGCPEIKREVRQLLQKAMQGIEFESGKATIKAKSYPLLDQIAQIFLENEDYIIEVQGHTDATGKAEANKKLSQDRADAVKKYLANKGVAESRMTAVGYGQEKPIADNKTKAGRQKNRRVEFNISFEEVHYETILDHADPAPATEE